jgi:hypothetical protein
MYQSLCTYICENLTKLLKYYIIKNNLDGMKKSSARFCIAYKIHSVFNNPCKNFYFKKSKTHDAELSKPDI